MRYSEIDLQCEDIIWFGIDSNGYILAFTSGGCGCVPEFVCRSKEETNKLEEFFFHELVFSSDSIIDPSLCNIADYDDIIQLSKNGIFVYDVSFEEGYGNKYSIVSHPSNPLHIDSLPDNIKLILNDHIINTANAGDRFIQIQHAY